MSRRSFMIPVMGRASVIAADFVLDSLHRARGSGRYADGLTRVAEFRGLMPPLGGNSTLTGGKVGHGIGLQSLRLLYGRRGVSSPGSDIPSMVRGSVMSLGHAGAQRCQCLCSANRVTLYCSYQPRCRQVARLLTRHSCSASHPRSPD